MNKLKLLLKNPASDSLVYLNGQDISNAVYRVEVVSDANQMLCRVNLGLIADVEIDHEGDIHLEYPHKVRKFFKGKAYGQEMSTLSDAEDGSEDPSLS